MIICGKIKFGPLEVKLMEYIGCADKKNAALSVEPGRSIEAADRIPDDTAYIEKLSERETDILRLLGKGLSNNEISKELYISTNTTQWHISHIFAKLGVKSRTQAVFKANELGIL
jgi:ATP/maltotriose-dependent transcriptional regulator MalT